VCAITEQVVVSRLLEATSEFPGDSRLPYGGHRVVIKCRVIVSAFSEVGEVPLTPDGRRTWPSSLSDGGGTKIVFCVLLVLATNHQAR
jgi:hypothetical protein